MVVRVVEFLIRERMATTAPIVRRDFFLDVPRQGPEMLVVFAENVVRELVAEGVAYDFVIAVAVVRVRAQTQLDDFASVAV